MAIAVNTSDRDAMRSQMVSMGVPLLAAGASCAFLLSGAATKLWIVGIALAAVAAKQQILSFARRCSFELTGLLAPMHLSCSLVSIKQQRTTSISPRAASVRRGQ